MNSKRGVELSMNLVIIGVIALLVLVVVILIFTGAMKNINGGISDCNKQEGGKLISESDCQKNGCGESSLIRYPPGDKDKQCCCVKNKLL